MRRTDDWSLTEIEAALKSMKNNKARDDYGFTYELFKYGGLSLKRSLLRFLNAVKREQVYPTILQNSSIASIWKKKGSKSDIENERSIIRM